MTSHKISWDPVSYHDRSHGIFALNIQHIHGPDPETNIQHINGPDPGMNIQHINGPDPVRLGVTS